MGQRPSSSGLLALRVRRSERAKKLIEIGGRVNFALPADYTEGSKLEKAVKAVVDKVAADDGLSRQGKRE